MLAPGREPIGFALNSWEGDLDLPGTWDVIHARKLMENRPFTDRIPYQQIVKNEYVPETDFIVATRGKNYIMVYIPTGWGAQLNLKLCGWPKAKGWWYNCKTGESELIGEVENNQTKTFQPKSRGRGNDWVLVLDNVNAKFDNPGIVK